MKGRRMGCGDRYSRQWKKEKRHSYLYEMKEEILYFYSFSSVKRRKGCFFPSHNPHLLSSFFSSDKKREREAREEGRAGVFPFPSTSHITHEKRNTEVGIDGLFPFILPSFLATSSSLSWTPTVGGRKRMNDGEKSERVKNERDGVKNEREWKRWRESLSEWDTQSSDWRRRKKN